MGKKSRERRQRNTFRATITGLGTGLGFLVAFVATGGDAQTAGLVMPASGGVVLGVGQVVYMTRRQSKQKAAAKAKADAKRVKGHQRAVITQWQNQIRIQRSLLKVADGIEVPLHLQMAREVADEALRLEKPDPVTLEVAHRSIKRLTENPADPPQIDRAALDKAMLDYAAQQLEDGSAD